MGVLHVQPENPAIRLRGIEDRDHLGQRVRFVDQRAKLRGPQLWRRTRTSDVRAASRSLAVFPAVPATTPTRRKIHQRRMSQPPMPARTPPITNRMIAPMKVLKMLNTPPPPRAAPTVPVMKPKNA